jgi:hypothetical protein
MLIFIFFQKEPELFSKFLEVVHRLISTNVMAASDAAANCLKAAASGGVSKGLEQVRYSSLEYDWLIHARVAR